MLLRRIVNVAENGYHVITVNKMNRKVIPVLLILSCFILYQNVHWISFLQPILSFRSHETIERVAFKQLNLDFNNHGIKVQIYNEIKNIAMTGIIGEKLGRHKTFEVRNKSGSWIELVFTPTLSLDIINLNIGKQVDCYNFLWSESSLQGGAFSFEDRISIEDSYWYGGALMHESYWPINNKTHSLAPFVTGNSYHADYGSVQERFWLSSSGTSIFVSYDVPLFVDINKLHSGWMTLVSKNKKPYSRGNNLCLNYTLCVNEGRSPRLMYEAAAGYFWRKPEDVPNQNLFKYPVWSTWAALKRSISSEVVLEFATKISSHGLRCSQFIIDDGWMAHYGDFNFSPELFPDPKALVGKLKELLNTSVSLWVHPFSSCFSTAFWKQNSQGKSYWVRKFFDWLPSQIMWWNGLGALIDLTNDEAYKWYLDELRDIQRNYDIDSFKFDAGESSWLPEGGVVEGSHGNPNDYTRLFSRLASESDFKKTKMQEIRSTVSSQHLPIFVRLIDKNSNWNSDNGIVSIIPQMLTVGILGYPFIFPDMIGGNGYLGMFIHFTVLPERELYIRWLQVSALMPAMQFSIPPWMYDEEVIEIARKMAELHESFHPVILSLAREAVITGAPIIRPLWWAEGGDEVGQGSLDRNYSSEIFTCETQFLLGNDLLVAPVLENGARSRKVYLPGGKWRRGEEGSCFEGGRWYEIDVPLTRLAYFARLNITVEFCR